jgi:hypothetical protein
MQFALIDEFGAEFATDPPRQPATARLAGREYQGEFGGNLEIFGENPRPAVRHVDDRAVAWQRANPKMHLGAAIVGAALAFPSIRKHRDGHRRSPFGILSRFTENLFE